MLDQDKVHGPIIFTWIKPRSKELLFDNLCYKYTFMRDEINQGMLTAHWIYRNDNGDYSAAPGRCTVAVVAVDASHLTIQIECPLRGMHDGSYIEIPLSECFEMKETVHPEHGYSRLSFIEGGE